MKGFYEKYETIEDFFPSISKDRSSMAKEERCSSCGRDTSQRNLLHPSISKSCINQKNISPGYGICHQCGGLGAGLFDGI